METKKPDEVLTENTSLYVRDDQPERKKKPLSRKTSLQKEKEEKNEKRNELHKQLKQVLAEQEEILRAESVPDADAGDLTGCELVHGKFGRGKVTASKGKFITIQFESKEIRMQMPDAFDKGLLSIPDESGAEAEKIEAVCAHFRKLEARKAELEAKANEIGLAIAELGS